MLLKTAFSVDSVDNFIMFSTWISTLTIALFGCLCGLLYLFWKVLQVIRPPTTTTT